MSKILHISDKAISSQARLIFTPVLHGECATIICYPTCKIAYNLSCYLQRPKLLKSILGPYFKKYEFITIPIEKNDRVQDILYKISGNRNTSLQAFCINIIRKGKEPYFFFLQAHEAEPGKLQEFISLFHSCVLGLRKVNGMIFFETNAVDSKHYEDMFRNNNKFLQNILYIPLYPLPERTTFLQNLANDWGISPSKNVVAMIANTFGGSLWFLREALRCIKDYSYTSMDEIVNTPGVKIRIQAFLDLLSVQEKKLLVHIPQNKKELSNSLHFLTQIGLVDNTQCTIPAILPYLKASTASDLICVLDGQIMFDGRDISASFFPQEKIVLSVLLNRKGSIVSREIIAKALWKDEWTEKYSDWAIDKLISRVRKTLKSIDIPPTTIQVKKGRGFQI